MKRLEIKIPHYGIWNTKHSCFIGFENSSLFWTTSIDVAREQMKMWQLTTSLGEGKYLEVREIGEAVSISCNESNKEAC